MTISINAGDVRTRIRQGKVGLCANESQANRSTTLVNADPQAAQVDTITVTGATNSKDYTETIDLVDVTYTSDTSATIAEIADGLAAEINDNALVRGKCSAVSDGVSVITVTGTYPGVSYTITDADAQLTTASVTVAATADAVPFGTLMVNPTGFVSSEADEYGIRMKASSFTEQVVTVTPVYAADTDTIIRIRDMHTGRVIAETSMRHDTNIADLITEIVTDLNTTLPAASVLAADVGGTALSLTAEVAGLEFDVEVGVGEGAAAAPSTVAKVYTTGPTVATSILRAARGVSLFSDDVEVPTVAGTDATYPANDGVRSLLEGDIWVESSQTITTGEVAYVETSSASADRGKFYNTDSATRLALPISMASWKRDAESGSGSIALLHVNF